MICNRRQISIAAAGPGAPALAGCMGDGGGDGTYANLNEGSRIVTLEADQPAPGGQRLTTQLANLTHIATDASDMITVTANLEDGDEPGGGGYGGDRYDA